MKKLVTFRLDADLLDRVKKTAQAENRTLTNFVETVLMLEDLGHTVLQANSADSALDVVRDHGQIDLVISDQAMPGMTGVQLAEALAQMRPGLRVILATGYAELPPGTDPRLHRLAKPFTQSQLALAVDAIAQA